MLVFKFFFIFWPYPWHLEIPRPEIKPAPQQCPKPQQGQCQILNPLGHLGAPWEVSFRWSPQCPLWDLSRQQPYLYTGFWAALPRPPLSLCPFPRGQSLLLVQPLAWRMRKALPTQRTKSANGLHSYLPPPSSSPLTAKGQTEPRVENVGESPSSVIIPEPVPGTQGRPHRCPPSSESLPSARSRCTVL